MLLYSSDSGSWHENKMVLVGKNVSRPNQLEEGWRRAWKIFVFKANMAKLSFNGRSKVFPDYPGLFDAMRYCQLQGLNGLAAFYH